MALNIFQQQASKFTKQPENNQVVSEPIQQPKMSINQSYAKPNALQTINKLAMQKPETTTYQKRYFSDEQQMANKMKQDGYDEEIIRQTIVNRRNSYLKKKKLDTEEAMMLINMADAGLDMPTAVEGLKAFRSDKMKKQWEDMNPLQKAGKTYFDFVLGTLGGGVGELGGITSFVTGGKSELGKMGMEGREFVREASPSIATKAGEVLGAGSVDYTLGTGLGKITGLGTKFNQLSPMKQIVAGGAGYGAATAIGEKGSEATMGDIATGAGIGAVGGYALGKALPVLGKTAGGIISKTKKYATATQKGGIEGLGKSIGRDITRPIKEIQTKGIAPEIAYQTSTKANRFRKNAEEQFKAMTGESTGEFAVKRGMTKTGDDAVEEAVKNFQASKKQADDAFNLIEGKFTTKGTKDDVLGDLIDGIYQKALKRTRGTDSKKSIALYNKYNEGGLSMSEINEAKRIYARTHKFEPEKRFSDDAFNSTQLQNDIREWQVKQADELGFKNIADINKTTQAWKYYADNLASNLAGKEPNMRFGITDWIALSGGEPTNIALYLGKKVGESNVFKRGVISKFAKATKEPIIKADTNKIIESNLKRKYGINNNISSSGNSGGIPPKLALPQKAGEGIKSPIITPQTAEKGVIAESKKELSRAKIKVPKTQEKAPTPKQEIQVPKKEVKIPKKDNQIQSIDPKTGEGFDKNGKSLGIVDKRPLETNLKSLTKDNIDDIASKITTDKTKLAQVKEVIQAHIKKYGNDFKNYMGELVDKIAEKVGAKINLMSSKEGIGIEKTKMLNKTNISDDVIKEMQKFTNGEDFYQQMSSEIRKKLKQDGLYFKGEFIDFFEKNKGALPKKETILDTINPTGGLYVEYNPKVRATAKLGPNITTLDKTMGVSPNKEITIYRGAPKNQKGIVAGDFVTTNYDLAKSYTGGDGKILELKVKAKDILDDIKEPLGEEYIYRPQANKIKVPKK